MIAPQNFVTHLNFGVRTSKYLFASDRVYLIEVFRDSKLEL